MRFHLTFRYENFHHDLTNVLLEDMVYFDHCSKQHGLHISVLDMVSGVLLSACVVSEDLVSGVLCLL